MRFKTSQILPLVSALGTYLKAGVAECERVTKLGQEVKAEALAVFLDLKMGSWNPKLKGVELLDEPTRKSGARFLAGVAVKIARS